MIIYNKLNPLVIICKYNGKIQKIIDLGPNSNISVDYPDYAKKLSKKVGLNGGGWVITTTFSDFTKFP